MVKKITAGYFLFDYDGTICNTFPTMNFALAKTFAEYQVKVPDELERLKAIGAGLTLHDTIRLLHPDAAQLNQSDVDAMSQTYRQLYLEVDEQLTVLFDGTRAVFNHLKGLGKKIVVLLGFLWIWKTVRMRSIATRLYHTTDFGVVGNGDGIVIL